MISGILATLATAATFCSRSCLARFLSRQIGQLNPVHQGIEAERLRVVVFRLDQRSQLFPHHERILIGQRLIILRDGVSIHVP